MARKSHLSDGRVDVKLVNGIYEIEAPYPSLAEETGVIFREFLTLNGNGVTNSMRVNGSVTNQDFYIQSAQDADTYITALSFYLGAELVIVDLVEFGNLPALANGCQLLYQSSTVGEIIIASPIRSNFDLINVCNANPKFGTGATVFEFTNATANASEGYGPVLYFSEYGFSEDGILLPAGTTDRLTFRIRDNLNVGLSSISKFDVIAQGFKRKSEM